MLRLQVAVAEDEATLLTVMTKGLGCELSLPEGKDVGYAKNRAIDQLPLDR